MGREDESKKGKQLVFVEMKMELVRELLDTKKQ